MPFTLTMPDNRYWAVGQQAGRAWRDRKPHVGGSQGWPEPQSAPGRFDYSYFTLDILHPPPY
jgi:hypothetical protein